MYGVNNDVGMVNYSVENMSGQAVHRKMREAGIGWVRYWLSWEAVEAVPGSYDWSRPDYDINAAIAQGMHVYVTVQGAPAWAHGDRQTYHWGQCNDPNSPGQFLASNPHCGPATFAPFDPGGGSQSFYWKRFVTKAVRRYGDRVKCWGFWNEGGSSWFYPEYPHAPCNNRFAQLMLKVIKPAREAALAASPSVQIVGPESHDGEFLSWALAAERNGWVNGACAIAPGRVFDIISLHTYPNQLGQFPLFDTYKRILDDYDRREVWITEFPAEGGRIDAVLPQFSKRGWIAKIFAFSARSMSPNVPCGGMSLLDFNLNACYSYNQFKSYIAANPPAMRFAGLSSDPGHTDYLLFQNPHGLATTVNLWFGNVTGGQIVRTLTMPANSRTNVNTWTQGWSSGAQGVTIQPVNPALPVWAEHSDYWGVDRQAGRGAQGAAERSDTWYFAEGAADGSYWRETISAYNPSLTASVIVTWTYVNQNSGPVTHSRVLAPGANVRVATTSVAGVEPSHGAIVSGKWASGDLANQPAPITAERTVTWGGGSGGIDIEGHSGKGVAFAAPNWYFAEGAAGNGFSTFIAVLNPSNRIATIWYRFMMDNNGFTAWSQMTLGAMRRGAIPAPRSGTFGIEVRSVLDNVPIVAERTMYYGPDFTVGTAGEGSPTTSQRWLFSEGTREGSYFSEYYLLANPSLVAAPVTLTFRGPAGILHVQNVTVPAGGRVTIDPYNYPPLYGQPFAMEAVVNAPGPDVPPPGIVAERAMYWPRGNWHGGTVALGLQ